MSSVVLFSLDITSILHLLHFMCYITLITCITYKESLWEWDVIAMVPHLCKIFAIVNPEKH